MMSREAVEIAALRKAALEYRDAIKAFDGSGSFDTKMSRLKTAEETLLKIAALGASSAPAPKGECGHPWCGAKCGEPTPEPMRCAECDCDNPPYGCTWIKTTAPQPDPIGAAWLRVKPLLDLVEEFTTAVFHLMDNSETSGPVDDPTITLWNPDYDVVSKLLDRIEALPSGSTEHLGIGELLVANIRAALAAAQEKANG
jgi:hypothetical protein